MNQFEELCKFASYERWCWKLGCTTCGHLHLRYAFFELAAGKSLSGPNWIIHLRKTHYSKQLGPVPRHYSDEQKEQLHEICSEANVSLIASSCKFPDWLGYLGLILAHMSSESKSFKMLSSRWADQLADLVSSESPIQARLQMISNGHGILNIDDLEACEKDIRRNNRPLLI